MDNEKLISSIKKSGYELEFYIYTILKKHGWQCINNRYYIDGNKGIER